MPKDIEAYGELTVAMKIFENARTVYLNKLADPFVIRAYQKSKAQLGNLLVDLMLDDKIEITVK